MKRLKGPDLKFPPFLVDLYWDLRDRRLLPLVALGIVAIVAVPFLLAGGSEQSDAPVAAAPNAAVAGGASELTVVRATPGLRDYRKRFRDRSPTDPFRQHFTAPDLSGSDLGSPGDNGFESSSTVTSTSTSSDQSTSTTKTTQTTTGADGKTTKTETTTHGNGLPPDSEAGDGGVTGATPYSAAIDLKFVRTTTLPDGGKEQTDPKTRERVLAATSLPSEKTQVITYLGISPKTGFPLFFVSSDVSSIFGEGNCLSGSQSCQMLELEPGLPVTFVYGPASARYKFTVLKVEPVVTGHP